MIDDERGNDSSRNLFPALIEADRETSPGKRRKNPLDGEKAMKAQKRLLSFYQVEIERHADNRMEMAKDHDFYDGDQFDPEVKQVMRDRGQPVITYNVTATTVDWVLGSEKRNRTDFKVLARRKEFSKDAEAKTDVLKYLSDVNSIENVRSRAFKDAVVGGAGWMEDLVTDDNYGDIIETRYESWRNVLWDSLSLQDDLRDARYLFRSRWIDADMLMQWFPNRQAVIENSITEAYEIGRADREDGDEFMDSQEDAEGIVGVYAREQGYFRDRVRAIECWYREVIPNRLILKGGQFHNQPYDEYNIGHEAALTGGESQLVGRPSLGMRHAVITNCGVLWAGPSPYQHNRFPFTPIWAFRRDRDMMPYGVVRRIRDLQTGVNNSASKAAHILNTNKTVMDEGAVDDLDKYLEEVNRPDAVIVKKPGKELIMNAERGLDQAHLDIMSRNIMMIQQTSGITDENMGRTTNAKSGIAIQARQDQGMLTTIGLFDNMRQARQQQGEKQLSLIEQYFTEPRTIRITNARKNATYRQINSPDDPEDQIARSKADFVVGEQDWSITLRQAYAEMLFDFAIKAASFNPMLSAGIIDLAVELMDLPNGEEIVKRIRAATGMSDPDADEPSPEEIQRKEAEAAAQERAIRMEMAAIMEKEGSARQKAAAADKAGADTSKVLNSLSEDNIRTLQTALQTALEVVSVPAAVPVADELLHEAGFKGQSEKEDDMAVDAKATQLEALAEQAAAQQQPAPMPSSEDPTAQGEVL